MTDIKTVVDIIGGIFAAIRTLAKLLKPLFDRIKKKKARKKAEDEPSSDHVPEDTTE